MDKRAQADRKWAKFIEPEGDHLTLLSVYREWEKHEFSEAWCSKNFVYMQTLKCAQDVRNQLLGIMDR
jgi:ATP-dependent RNA helicase DHX8/PRP22